MIEPMPDPTSRRDDSPGPAEPRIAGGRAAALRQPADPGGPGSLRAAWIVGLLAFVMIAGLQNIPMLASQAGVSLGGTDEGGADGAVEHGGATQTGPAGLYDPELVRAIENDPMLVVVFAAFGGVLLLSTAGGLALLVVFLARLERARPRMPVPERGGSVFLETFAVFCVAFLVVSVGTDALVAGFPGARWPIYAKLVGQWSLALVPLWPLARGMGWRRFAGTVGLHKGEGLFKEIGYGVLGSLASTPLFIGGTIVAVVLVVVAQAVAQALGLSSGGDPGATTPLEGIEGLLGSGDPVLTALLVSLVVLWAPLVEELIFRGALHRHLRARMGFLGAGLVGGFVFALMHPYGLLVFAIAPLGLAFSAMREMRGSLIAPMTAHFIHNGLRIVVMLALFQSLAKGGPAGGEHGEPLALGPAEQVERDPGPAAFVGSSRVDPD
jgi:membrane protease YdiL (CAAX protease family)